MQRSHIILFGTVLLLVFGGYFFYSNVAHVPIRGEGAPSSGSLTYENASADLISVVSPKPGETVGNVFSVSGTARGYWYFEASFPIEVRDQGGAILVHTYASAEGEWMTEEFVPFKSRVELPALYSGPATLMLRKDNPSGLPEHDASVSFPIVIQ